MLRAFVFSFVLFASSFLFVHEASATAIGLTMQNTQVVQARLEGLGYNTNDENGIMGPATRNAVANFQRDHGIYATGELNIETYQMLLGAVYAPSLEQPAYGYAVPVAYVAQPVYASNYVYAPPANITYYQSATAPAAATATPIAGYPAYATSGAYYSYPVATYPGVNVPMYMGRNLP